MWITCEKHLYKKFALLCAFLYICVLFNYSQKTADSPNGEVISALDWNMMFFVYCQNLL